MSNGSNLRYNTNNIDCYKYGFVFILTILLNFSSPAFGSILRIHEGSSGGKIIINEELVLSLGEFLIFQNFTINLANNVINLSLKNQTIKMNYTISIDGTCNNPCYILKNDFLYHYTCTCTPQSGCIDPNPTTMNQKYLAYCPQSFCPNNKCWTCMTSSVSPFNLLNSPVFKCDSVCLNIILYVKNAYPSYTTRVCGDFKPGNISQIFYNSDLFTNFDFMSNSTKCYNSVSQVLANVTDPACSNVQFNNIAYLSGNTLTNNSRLDYFHKNIISQFDILIPSFLFNITKEVFHIHTGNLSIVYCLSKICMINLEDFDFTMKDGDLLITIERVLNPITCHPTSVLCLDPIICCNSLNDSFLPDNETSLYVVNEIGIYIFDTYPRVVSLIESNENVTIFNITQQVFIINQTNYYYCYQNCSFTIEDEVWDLEDNVVLVNIVKGFSVWEISLLSIGVLLTIVLVILTIFIVYLKTKVKRLDIH